MALNFLIDSVEPNSVSLQDLSEVISKNSQKISQYMLVNSFPQPSREVHGPVFLLPNESPQCVRQARQEVLAASLEICQLMIGPSDFLAHLATGVHYVSCLTWIMQYNILHLVPLDGSISYTDLASGADVPESRLKSILRMAMTSSLFREQPSGTHVCHSAVSAFLVGDEDAYSYAFTLCFKTLPMSMRMTEAHQRWGCSMRANETAHNIAFNTDLPFFEYLAQDKVKMDQFARYMKGVRSSEGVALKHLVDGIDLGYIPPSGVLVDVGGSTGSAAAALAKAYPHIYFTIQDLPENIESGIQAVESLPASITSRLTFQSHDFTLPQSVQGADAYLLRMILHDWSDDKAINILRNIVGAMDKKRSRLFIMDTVLPKPGSVPISEERIARARDLVMMQAFNSKERELGEWEELLTAADPRLKLVSTNQPFGSIMAILEVKLSE